MAQPFQVEILSDEDELSPFKFKPKRRRNKEQERSTVVIIDDDFTPAKPNPNLSSTASFVSETPFKSDVSFSEKPNPILSTPSFVPETPTSSDSFKADVSFVKCTAGLSWKPNPMLSTSSFVADTPMSPDSFVKCTAGFSYHKIGSSSEKKYSGISGLICLESDNESENGCEKEKSKKNKDMDSEMENLEIRSRFPDHPCSHGADNLVQAAEDRAVPGECSYGYGDDVPQLYSYPTEENTTLEGDRIAATQKGRGAGKKNNKEETMQRKRKMKEEKARLIEEKKLKREQEKLQKEALKAEAAEMKKLQKEQQKWETGKFALQSITAEIDAKVVELGSIGGHILTRFAEKGITYRVTSNLIERSILWKMTVPEQISKISSKGLEVSYILLVYEADEFCNLIINETLMDHVCRVRSRFPSYTICYLTNKLKAYINKREQAQYKDSSNNTCWSRPPVEEVLSTLTTEFAGIHSRQCADEAELADHIVGLTSSLANCQFRRKLTRLSINANGALIPKDFVDKNLKKSVWLKALIAIPKVQPRFAVAICKKYLTMRSLLSVYMDPTKSVHEKEFLLKDLKTEGLLGNEDRRVGEVCSKRVYRILMAQNGNIKTEVVEDGADLFRC